MKKYKLILLILIFPLLFFLPYLFTELGKTHGFKRTFTKGEALVTNILQLDNSLFSLTGKPDSCIRLRNFNSPFQLFSTTMELKGLDSITIKPPGNFDLEAAHTQIRSQPSNFYLNNKKGNLALFFGKTKVSHYVRGQEFDQAQVISKNSVIARSKEIVQGKRTRFLEKVHLSPNPKSKPMRYTLPRQVDGWFCTDGWLQYDFQESKLYYLYAYRGTFLCIDTNLRSIISIKTIDTVTLAKLNLAEINIKLKDDLSAKKSTQASPPVVVNRGFCLDNGRIYIMSGLRADNEDTGKYYQNQPIDVYSLQSKKYLFSFYVPRFKGIKPRQIEVKGMTMFALYGHYLVSIDLRQVLPANH